VPFSGIDITSENTRDQYVGKISGRKFRLNH
jgi:hypothetical protein